MMMLINSFRFRGILCTGVQPVALNLSQTARGRVPVLPYVIPSTLSAQSSASAIPAKQGSVCHQYRLGGSHSCHYSCALHLKLSLIWFVAN